VSKLINKKSVVLVLAAAGLVGGGVAYAYPPDAALTVSAVTNGSNDATVTINNANPGCGTQIELDGTVVKTVPATGNTNPITTTVPVTGLTGRHSISVRTVGCPKGSKERAKSKFVILTSSGNITYPTNPTVGSYVVKFSGLTPGTTTVSVVATGPGKQDSDTDTVDRRGEASLKVKLKPAGTWTIVTTIKVGSSTTTESKTVTVS
jgi:hypothetical protein